MARTTNDRATRSRDLKILAVTALIVIAAGSLIAWGFTKVGGDEATECGEQALGIADVIRRDEDLALAPQYRSFGGDCDLWLTMQTGELTAVRRVQPDLGCTVRVDPVSEQFLCGDRTVPLDDLAQWRLIERDVDETKGVLIVDFGAPAAD